MHKNVVIAQKYYHEMLQKNFVAMADCLHQNVLFVGPLAEMSGKDMVVSAAKGLTQILKDIKIRSVFASDDQVMFAYDFFFPEPIGTLRAAVLMNFTDDLISKIELFYDARPFEQKKGEIFKNKKS